MKPVRKIIRQSAMFAPSIAVGHEYHSMVWSQHFRGTGVREGGVIFVMYVLDNVRFLPGPLVG